MTSISSAATSPAPTTPSFNRANGPAWRGGWGTGDASGEGSDAPADSANPRSKGRKQRMSKSASALKVSQSRLRMDSGGSPYRSNASSAHLQEYFHSSAGALAAAGRERDAGRDHQGNRWHAHSFPKHVDSLCDVTALVDLVDGRGGQYETLNMNEDQVRDHVKRAPKKVRSALQEYYDSQLEIIDGWREADEILESSFPTEVLRRYGTEDDVERFLAKSRFSQLHLNRLAAVDNAEDSDTGYEEDGDGDEDEDEEGIPRRGSIARAASALSGFWFNANSQKAKHRKREHSGLSSDDLEENAALLGGRDDTTSRGRRGLTRSNSGAPYGATAFSSQIPSTTPIAEHQQEGSGSTNNSKVFDAPAATSKLREYSPFSGRQSTDDDASVARGRVDPHARKDSPSGRIVSVESEASAKEGTGRASEDGSLDRKLARAREQKERDLTARESALKSTKDRDQAKATVENEERSDRLPAAADDTTDDDDGIMMAPGPSALKNSTTGFQPLAHRPGSTITLRSSTNTGGPDADFKGDRAAEGTNVLPASGQSNTAPADGKDTAPARPTSSSSSSSNNNANKNSKRTAVGTLQERERRLLLETVPGKMEKEAEVERGTQFAININLAINIVLIAGKGLAVVTSNSVSLIASFVDSVLDLLSTVIIFITSKAIAYRSSHTVWKYPVGKKRFEPLGVVVFSVLMLASFSQVLVESIERLMKVLRSGKGEIENPAELPTLGIVFMVITIVVKMFMWLLYRNSPSSGVRALAQDAQNDVVFNVASLLFPVLGSLLHAPALDPIGGIVLSLYIIKEWLETLGSTVTRLSGAVAGKEHLARALYLVTRFRQVKAVSAFELYYSGDEVIAEADVVLPINTPLKEAHDVCEVVTYCLEVLDIERAYVARYVSNIREGPSPIYPSGSDSKGWEGLPSVPGATIKQLPVGSQSATLTVYETDESSYDASKILRAVIMVAGIDRVGWNEWLFLNASLVRASQGGVVDTNTVVLAAPEFHIVDDAGAYPVDPITGAPSSTTLVWADKEWGEGDNAVFPDKALMAGLPYGSVASSRPSRKNPSQRDGPGVGSFDALDALVESYLDRSRFPNLNRVVVGGFSLGGQLLNRYSLFGGSTANDDRVTYWLSSPGSFVYLNSTRPEKIGKSCSSTYDDYKFGLQGTLPAYVQVSNANTLGQRLASRTVRYLVGLMDTAAGDNGCEANAQGSSHVNKMLNWVQVVAPYLPGAPGDGSLPQNTTVSLIRNTPHNDGRVIQSDPGVATLFLEDYPSRGRNATAPPSNGDSAGTASEASGALASMRMMPRNKVILLFTSTLSIAIMATLV
ncbi:unnamed protein product [Tilletia controversa]|nr:unnamed protein product [Tilletia controversa]